MRQVKKTEKGFIINVDASVLHYISEGLKDWIPIAEPNDKRKIMKLVNDIYHAQGLEEPF